MSTTLPWQHRPDVGVLIRASTASTMSAAGSSGVAQNRRIDRKSPVTTRVLSAYIQVHNVYSRSKALLSLIIRNNSSQSVNTIGKSLEAVTKMREKQSAQMKHFTA